MPNIEKLEGDGGNHVLAADIHITKHEAQRPDFEQLLDARLADLRRAVLAAVAVAGWR